MNKFVLMFDTLVLFCSVLYLCSWVPALGHVMLSSLKSLNSVYCIIITSCILPSYMLQRR